MKEVYLKTSLSSGDGEFVLFDHDEDRDTEFVKDGYRYEWVDNFDIGEVFYTLHFDDAEGNFVEDPLNDYYDDFEDAKKRCYDCFGSQDPDSTIGMYVMEWHIAEDEVLDCECVFEIKLAE